MAQNENTKLVQSLYDAFAQGNVPISSGPRNRGCRVVDEGPESIRMQADTGAGGGQAVL